MAVGAWAALVPALTSAVGAFAQSSSISNRTDNILKAIDLESDSYMQQVNIMAEQEQDIERELGDAMTQRGLEALKAEARLRAAAAETGTVGGTTELSIREARMTQALDNAILISRAKSAESDLYRRRTTSAISYKNRMNELAGSIQSPMSAGLSVFNTSMSGLQTGLNLYSALGGEINPKEK